MDVAFLAVNMQQAELEHTEEDYLHLQQGGVAEQTGEWLSK